MSMGELFDEVTAYLDNGIHLSSGSVVFDVGANIGAFSILASKVTRGDVSLFCFEPAPVSFAALTQNREHNRWFKQSQVRLLQCALTSPENAGKNAELFYFTKFPTDTTLDIADKRKEFSQFLSHYGTLYGDRIRARVPGFLGQGMAAPLTYTLCHLPSTKVGTKLADFLSGMKTFSCEQESLSGITRRFGVTKIDLLKVDVEGHEDQVLLGIDDATWANIGQVVLETHDRNGRLSDVRDLLARYGLRKQTVVRPSIAVERGLDNVLIAARRD